MTNDQLRARLFTLSAARGPKWGLDYTEDIMRRYGEQAWVISCGAEMLLRNQLPERAASLEYERASLLMAHCVYLLGCDPWYIWKEHQRPTYRRGLSLRLLRRWASEAQLPERAESLHLGEDIESREDYEAQCLFQGKAC